ncbi:hypothetical protein ASPFODRAFT_557368 [Aspergillus luchuensis CBS 106.47]|uniref:Uncharacterized protein n=1 Tax=Aspergillus luchuensis (strain CBS 106.47) TaxID=1137211 RepID=A0A1M3SYQ6_ASPLC|nr:hypothetical protein ASPFODRAFT_557368 [Aspergillus luchuensis CBS 106.47]
MSDGARSRFPPGKPSASSRRHACDRCRRQKLKVRRQDRPVFPTPALTGMRSISAMLRSHVLYACALALSARQPRHLCASRSDPLGLPACGIEAAILCAPVWGLH